SCRGSLPVRVESDKSWVVWSLESGVRSPGCRGTSNQPVFDNSSPITSSNCHHVPQSRELGRPGGMTAPCQGRPYDVNITLHFVWPGPRRPGRGPSLDGQSL